MATELARVFSLLDGMDTGIIFLYVLILPLLGYNGTDFVKVLMSKKNNTQKSKDFQNKKDAFIQLTKKASDLVEQKSSIENYSVIEEQMRHADDILEKTKNMYVDRYIELLKKDSSGDTIDSNEFLRFDVAVSYTIKDPKDYIRFLMRKNRLSEMSSQETKSYIDDNVQVIINKIERGLDKLHPLFLLSINRQRLYQSTRNERGELKRMFSEFVHQAKGISERRSDDVAQIDNQLKELVQQIIDYYMKDGCE